MPFLYQLAFKRHLTSYRYFNVLDVWLILDRPYKERSKVLRAVELFRDLLISGMEPIACEKCRLDFYGPFE